MIDQINELPEDGLKSSSETSHLTENKWISRKNQNMCSKDSTSNLKDILT